MFERSIHRGPSATMRKTCAGFGTLGGSLKEASTARCGPNMKMDSFALAIWSASFAKRAVDSVRKKLVKIFLGCHGFGVRGNSFLDIEKVPAKLH
jgi:hypothetical protein